MQSQEWLLVSCSAWHLIPDYQRLEEFARNLPVTNERGWVAWTSLKIFVPHYLQFLNSL